MALLEVTGVERSFYGVHALCGVDLKVEAGRITGLIGPNGAGKTTLFNCITGVVPRDLKGSHEAPRAHLFGPQPGNVAPCKQDAARTGERAGPRANLSDRAGPPPS